MMKFMYFVYILRFSDYNLYIGQTNDLEKRLKEHLNGSAKSSKFAKDHGKFELVYHESYESRVESMKREKQLKGWLRCRKLALIKEENPNLEEINIDS